jgi:hypothetical protein
MKTTIRLFGIIAITAIIGFTVIACDNGSGNGNGGGGNGGGSDGMGVDVNYQ